MTSVLGISIFVKEVTISKKSWLYSEIFKKLQKLGKVRRRDTLFVANKTPPWNVGSKVRGKVSNEGPTLA